MTTALASSVREGPARGGRTPRGTIQRGKTCTQAIADTARTGSAGAPAGGRLTLEQRLDSVWEGLHLAGVAECPVCGGELSCAAAGMTVRCARCGSQLS